MRVAEEPTLEFDPLEVTEKADELEPELKRPSVTGWFLD